jgi:hypothetical protein
MKSMIRMIGAGLKRQRRAPIPAQGKALGADRATAQGLKARPIRIHLPYSKVVSIIRIIVSLEVTSTHMLDRRVQRRSPKTLGLHDVVCWGLWYIQLTAGLPMAEFDGKIY